MLHIVLYQPEIAPNTGNIIRLCANTGSCLHLIHPMGFALTDKACRRAGLDYSEYAKVQEYPSFEAFLKKHPMMRLFSCTTKATQNYSHVAFLPGDGLLFGPETRGLPDEILSAQKQETLIRIPMKASSRSLNLSNAVAIITYEAYRQLEFNALV